MGCISDKLAYLEETKQLIRTTLEELGATVTDEDTFRSYVEKIVTSQDAYYITKSIEYAISGVDDRPYESTVLGTYRFASSVMICPKIVYPSSYDKEILIPFSMRGGNNTYNTNITGVYITYHRVIAPETCGVKIALNMLKTSIFDFTHKCIFSPIYINQWYFWY